MPTKTLGRYIVTDPAICHGKPTFRGTRIMARGCAGTGSQWHGMGGDHRRMPRCTGKRCNRQKPVRMAREALVAHATGLVKKMAAARELSALIERGIIERHGRTGRGTVRHSIRAKGLKRLINDSMWAFGNDE